MKRPQLVEATVEWYCHDGETLGAKGELRGGVMACSMRGNPASFKNVQKHILATLDLLEDVVRGARSRASVMDATTTLDVSECFESLQARWDFGQGRVITLEGKAVEVDGRRAFDLMVGGDRSLLRHDATELDARAAVAAFRATVKEAVASVADPGHIWKRLFQKLSE